MGHDNYTHPAGRAPSINVGDISVTSSEIVDRNYSTFYLTDDVRNWRPIPLKLIDNLASPAILPALTKAIVIPITGNPSLMSVYDYTNQFNYFNTFKRQLSLNVQNAAGDSRNQKQWIPLQRPTGKKAYLNSIYWAAFDYNIPLPTMDVATLMSALQISDESKLIVTNAFGTGINGVVIALTTDSDNYSLDKYSDSDHLTTAHYPDMSSTYQERLRNLKIININQSSSPRSGILKGQLSADWMMNNFAVGIGGSETNSTNGVDLDMPSVMLWDSRGRINPTDSSENLSFGEKFGIDTICPLETNDINLLIPDEINFLTIDIIGPGWFVFTQVIDRVDSEKGIISVAPGPSPIYRTLVQMPIKIQLDVRYA